LWRYSCITKFTRSIVTYLIFEFLIPACYTYTYMCAYCTLCMKMHCNFLLNITGPHSCIEGRPPNTTMRPRVEEGWAEGGSLGASLGPRGASNSLAPALNWRYKVPPRAPTLSPLIRGPGYRGTSKFYWPYFLIHKSRFAAYFLSLSSMMVDLCAPKLRKVEVQFLTFGLQLSKRVASHDNEK